MQTMDQAHGILILDKPLASERGSKIDKLLFLFYVLHHVVLCQRIVQSILGIWHLAWG